jgi:hypothetical protein
MFVRFRQVGRRLKVSLVETRRTEGKVRHEHIAGLGSVVIPSDVPERIAFWRKLHERLARLANRIDSETQGKILGQVHGRIPMPTVDEMRALQIENAKADARLWSELQSRHDELVAGQIGLRDAAEKKITENRAASENAKRHAAIARERLEKLSRGEAVAGDLGRPVSLRDQLKAAGFSEADLRAAEEWPSAITPRQIVAKVPPGKGGLEELQIAEILRVSQRCMAKRGPSAPLQSADAICAPGRFPGGFPRVCAG